MSPLTDAELALQDRIEKLEEQVKLMDTEKMQLFTRFNALMRGLANLDNIDTEIDHSFHFPPKQ